MGDKDRLDLDGDGFSRDALSPDELAKHRHMHHHYTRHFLESDDFVRKLGIGWMVSLSKAGPVLVKVIVGAGVIGAALRWASEAGFF